MPQQVSFVEVVPISEGPLSEVPLYRSWSVRRKTLSPHKPPQKKHLRTTHKDLCIGVIGCWVISPFFLSTNVSLCLVCYTHNGFIQLTLCPQLCLDDKLRVLAYVATELLHAGGNK